MHTKVYHVYGNKYDLFFGDGWKDWTRVIVKKDSILVIAGKYRTQQILSSLFVFKKES